MTINIIRINYVIINIIRISDRCNLQIASVQLDCICAQLCLALFIHMTYKRCVFLRQFSSTRKIS